MASPHDPDALTGSPLDAFLDHADETLERQDEAGVPEPEIERALRELLNSQRCRPDSLQALERLRDLWLRADQPATALRLLDAHAATVLQTLSPDERAEAALDLVFLRLEALEATGDAAALHDGLAQAEATLFASAPSASLRGAWSRLGHWATDATAHEQARRCWAAAHALQIAEPERASYRAWDDAQLAVQRGTSFAAEGRVEDARASARQAMDGLARAAADQDVDHDDWLRLGDGLVTLRPEGIPDLMLHTLQRVPAGSSAALRRSVDVRLARLEAKAAAQRGDLAGALRKSREGRFWLNEDEDDAFSALVLDWLVQARQWEEAGRLALECVFNDRGGSSRPACELAAAQRAADPDAHPYWALTLACAVDEGEGSWLLGDEAPAAFHARQMAYAQAAAAAHPVIQPALNAVQAFHLLRTRRDHAAALPLLEYAVRHADQASSKNIEQLWESRMRVHGLARGLALPYVETASGAWSYNVGVALAYRLRRELSTSGDDWPQAAATALEVHYYEAGLAQFERFFDSGIGSFRDGDAHTYSMLCNNLGIHYRYVRNDTAAALVLHQKGIAASPFAEHFDGAMHCQQALGQTAGFVQAADRLWHFASDHGYGRHAPLSYLDDVADALVSLGRQHEIAIWLQRMDEWWDAQDEDAQREHRVTYLARLVHMLANLAEVQPEDALLRLEASLPQILSLQIPGCTRLAGVAMQHAGQPQRALALYEQALTQRQNNKEIEAAQHGYARDDIARLTGRSADAARPWWRFWA